MEHKISSKKQQGHEYTVGQDVLVLWCGHRVSPSSLQFCTIRSEFIAQCVFKWQLSQDLLYAKETLKTLAARWKAAVITLSFNYVLVTGMFSLSPHSLIDIDCNQRGPSFQFAPYHTPILLLSLDMVKSYLKTGLQGHLHIWGNIKATEKNPLWYLMYDDDS